jgi:hypothetical protein
VDVTAANVAVKAAVRAVLEAKRAKLRFSDSIATNQDARVNDPLKKSSSAHRAKRKFGQTSRYRRRKNSLRLKTTPSKPKMARAADVVAEGSAIGETVQSVLRVKINRGLHEILAPTKQLTRRMRKTL